MEFLVLGVVRRGKELQSSLVISAQRDPSGASLSCPTSKAKLVHGIDVLLYLRAEVLGTKEKLGTICGVREMNWRRVGRNVKATVKTFFAQRRGDGETSRS